MKRLFSYIKFYLEPESKALRAEAFAAAKQYYALRPVRSTNHPYPHPIEYTRRREAFQAYQRAYINNYRHAHAKKRLESLD
jgi:hypothetical protein